MARPCSKQRWWAALLLLAALTLVGAACGDDDDAAPATAAPGEVSRDLSGGDEDVSAPATTAAPSAGDFGEVGAPLGSGGVRPIALQPADIGRDIIFTADLTVAVSDVAAAGIEATSVVESVGGLLFGQRTTGDPQPVSVLTFKVFPEDFQEVLRRLGAIGEIRTQNVLADDVTERIVDLESRIKTSAVSVDRLRGFLENAGDFATIAQLENQLLERETQLETLRGQLRTLRDRVDLATIVLTLTEALSRPAIQFVTTAYPGHDEGSSCPGDFELVVDADEDATVCFEILNSGDTPLAGLEVSDTVLDLELDDLVVMFGDPQGTIEPGQSVVFAAEIVVERRIQTRTRVTATPVNDDGRPVEGRSVAATSSVFISAVDPGGLPGFGDGLSASWDVLQTTGGLVILFAGSILPFIWVLALAWIYFAWRRRHKPAAVVVEEEPDDGAANEDVAVSEENDDGASEENDDAAPEEENDDATSEDNDDAAPEEKVSETDD